MKWYKFLKKVGGYPSSETYMYLDESKDIKKICLEWSEDESGGTYRGFTYSWSEIQKPPDVWIEQQIKNCKYKIEKEDKKLKFFESLLNEESNFEEWTEE